LEHNVTPRLAEGNEVKEDPNLRSHCFLLFDRIFSQLTASPARTNINFPE